MICPVGKFILVKPQEKIDRESTTSSGIILVDAKDDRLELAVTKGTIVRTGEQVSVFKKDDIVYYNYFAGNQVIVPGKDPLGKEDVTYHLILEMDILASEND